MKTQTNKVTQFAPSADAVSALPPFLHAFVAKRAVIAALREQLAGHARRLNELEPRMQAITTMRAEQAQLTEEFQALRAVELRGEEADTARLREIERRRTSLAQQLAAQGDEAAALSRAITALRSDVGELQAQIDRHGRELPGLLAAAGREDTLEKVKAGRLTKLVQYIAAELADIFAGANVSELQRAEFPDARIPPCLSVRVTEERDAIVLPWMDNCQEFEQALAAASVDVMTPMRQSAQALLIEFIETPAG